MKPNRLLPRLLLQLSVLALVLCAFAPMALADTAGGGAPPITTAYVVTMVLGIVLGFLAQGIKQGNLLGLLKVQASWVPALAVVLTFGTGLEQGLSGQPSLTGAVWLNAIFTAFLGLLGQAGGATLHGHTHWSSQPSGAGSSGSANAVSGAAKAAAAAGSMLAVLLLVGCASFLGAASATLDCGSKVLDDASRGMSMQAILADVPSECGYDLAKIVGIIAASKDPRVKASRAYGEVLQMKGALDEANPGQ